MYMCSYYAIKLSLDVVFAFDFIYFLYGRWTIGHRFCLALYVIMVDNKIMLCVFNLLTHLYIQKRMFHSNVEAWKRCARLCALTVSAITMNASSLTMKVVHKGSGPY